jgi:cyanophycinase
MRLLLALAAAPLFAQGSFEYLRAGNAEDVRTVTRPGYVLMGGGTDVAEAFQWMIERAGGGDFLVLRATGTDAYNPFVMRQGRVNSAATLILRDREASSNPEVIERVRQAEAIFFAGGDQWNYVSRWKDTPLMEALQQRIRDGVPVGGTSAGLAILGQFYFPAKFDSIISDEALGDPFHRRLTLGSCFLSVPGLESVITDSHFGARTRMGRLVAFLARLINDGLTERARGIGVDERTAVLLEPDGAARVVGVGNAYFLEAAAEPERCEAGRPLVMRGVATYRVDAQGRFNTKSWQGEGGVAYELSARDGLLESTQSGGRVY